jgi:hypothetical protein
MKILIGGDSWGCGEWGYDNGNYCILHGGLDQYLINDGHNVTNTSKGGSSNKGSITRLKNTLDFKPDFIIWLQCDPLRDNRPYNNFTDICNTWDNLVNYNNSLLLEHYKLLNDIGEKIYCIGGCSKIKIDLMTKFSNLIPLIESVPEFLYPHYKHPKIWSSDWITKIDELNYDVLVELKKCKRLQDMLSHKFHAKYFQPDGLHANRLGHFKMYEYFKSFAGLT